jgi:hypothetical protein
MPTYSRLHLRAIAYAPSTLYDLRRRRWGPARLDQLLRVHAPFRGVIAKGEKILVIPGGSIIRVLIQNAGDKWATIEWNGIEIRVFQQDLEERTESTSA